MTMTTRQYAEWKLKLLQRDFLLKLTEEEIEHMYTLPNEIQIDAYARRFIRDNL